MPITKTIPQIETWRNEVSASISPPTPTPTPTTPSPTTPPPPPHSHKVSSQSSSSQPDLPASKTLQGSSSTSRSLWENFKRLEMGKDKAIEEKDGARTDMYHNGQKAASRGSMNTTYKAESEDVNLDIEERSEDDVLRTKRERLERAARLLDSSRIGKEENVLKNGEAKMNRGGDG